MKSRIQTRADRYADAVTESVQATMREHGLEEPVGQLTVSQLVMASTAAEVDLCSWFPLRVSVC
jgi:hypothetical protein